jgi:hypothetical protein
MAFEGDLKSLLSPLFSGGFHPVINDGEDITIPYGTYFNVSGSDLTIHSGNQKRRRVQIDAFAKSYAAASVLAFNIDKELDESTIACSLINQTDAYEETPGVFRTILDYYMWG